MNPDKHAIVADYSIGSDGEKLRWLAALAHNLTNSARGQQFDYREHSKIALEKMAAVNDLQEHCTAMMMHLLDRDPSRYPDDVFVEVLFDIAQKAEIEDELQWAFTAAMEPAKAARQFGT